MDAVITQLQDLFEGQIDFSGQSLVESLYTTILTIASIIGLAVGYVRQDIYLTMWTGLAGTLLAMLIVVPPWPLFNQHPQSWIGSKPSLPSVGIVVGGQKG